MYDMAINQGDTKTKHKFHYVTLSIEHIRIQVTSRCPAVNFTWVYSHIKT